jgi:hypothetical protein
MFSVVDFKGLLSDDGLKCLVIVRERSKLDTLKIQNNENFKEMMSCNPLIGMVSHSVLFSRS